MLPVSDEGYRKIELNPEWAKEMGYSLSRLADDHCNCNVPGIGHDENCPCYRPGMNDYWKYLTRNYEIH
jgi:hypothetical protein